MVSRRSLSLILRSALMSVLVLMIVFFGAALLLRGWINSDSGRHALVSALNGQEIEGLGRISLGPSPAIRSPRSKSLPSASQMIRAPG